LRGFFGVRSIDAHVLDQQAHPFDSRITSPDVVTPVCSRSGPRPLGRGP
jgi:hypothetical protein